MGTLPSVIMEKAFAFLHSLKDQHKHPPESFWETVADIDRLYEISLATETDSFLAYLFVTLFSKYPIEPIKDEVEISQNKIGFHGNHTVGISLKSLVEQKKASKDQNFLFKKIIDLGPSSQTSCLQPNEWDQNWRGDEQLKEQLAKKLKVPFGEQKTVDELVLFWLKVHYFANPNPEATPVYERANIIFLQRMEGFDHSTLLYAMARVLKMERGLDGLYFSDYCSSAQIWPLRDKLLGTLTSCHPKEYISLLEYLISVEHFFYLFDDLFGLETKFAVFKKATLQQRDTILKLFLKLFNKISHYDNLVVLKKIFSFFKNDNFEAIQFLNSFKFGSGNAKAGRDQFLELLFRCSFGKMDLFERFKIQQKVLYWLASAPTRTKPTSSWIKKYHSIVETVNTDFIDSLCNWILDHEDLRQHFSDSDEAFKRYFKSAGWYKDLSSV